MSSQTGPDPLQQGRYSREQLFANFFRRPTFWLRDNLDRYDGDPSALIDEIAAKLPTLEPPLKPVFTALLLMWLGRKEGTAAVREVLRGEADDPRLFVLDQLRKQPPPLLDEQRRVRGTTLAIDDVARDLAPLLATPERVGADWALALCLEHAFEAARPAFGSLRGHPRWQIAGKVLDAYRVRNVDAGTLTLLETWLSEPGIRNTQLQRERLHGLCRLLGEWVAHSTHAFIPRQLGKLAVTVLQQAMDAHDRAVRLQANGQGWLVVEPLLAAVGKTRPDGALWLLQRMAGQASLDPLLRAQALVHHLRIGGKPHDQRAAILAALWALPRETRVPESLVAGLLQGGLLDINDIAVALRHPLWAWPLARQRSAWPPVPADALVDALLGGLEACAVAGPLWPSALQALAGLLPAPLDEGQRQRAFAALRAAHATPATYAGARAEVAALQLRLGDRAGVDLDLLPPWQAMYLHWERHGLDWPAVAGLLADAGMIEALDPAALADLPAIARCIDRDHGDDDSDLYRFGHDALLELFTRGGRPPHEAHLRDSGFEHHHDRLFADLAALLHPPLPVEQVAQIGQLDFTVVNPDASSIASDDDSGLRALHGVPVLSTDGSEMAVGYVLDGEARRFAVFPGGTWSDDGSVLDHLNEVLAERGHPQRLYSLFHWADWGDEGAHYLAMPVADVAALQQRLRLPLRTPPDLRPPPAQPMHGTAVAAPTQRSHLLDWTLRYPA